MKKIIKEFQSPYFQNEKRQILILEPNKITKKTPILFFFDGQILKLNEIEFNQSDGIDLKKSLKNIGKFIIIAVNSMNNNKLFKYKKRVKELKNKDNNNYLFFKKVKEEIIELKKKYQGKWFGFGFSLSCFLIGINKKLFDQSILISPYFMNNKFKLPQNSIVFYGKKEYKFFSNKKVNKPIQKIKSINQDINFIELKNMKHTFKSWNDYFNFILKCSIKPFLEFSKFNLNGVGKFSEGNSNISFFNKNKHLKIKANNIENFGLEKEFINSTHYKNDYQFIDDITYIKNIYNGKIKKQLNNQNIVILAKEIKKIHSLKINKKIQIYKNIPFKDKLVMTHGDLNHKNILFSKTKVFLIDFEWARLNSKYWDICSIFIFFNLNIKQKKLFLNSYELKIDKEKIKKMTKHLLKIIKNFSKDFPDYFITK